MKSKVAHFEQERIEDFKKCLENLLDDMIFSAEGDDPALEAF